MVHLPGRGADILSIRDIESNPGSPKQRQMGSIFQRKSAPISDYTLDPTVDGAVLAALQAHLLSEVAAFVARHTA